MQNNSQKRNLFKSGLVSITFRNLSPERILELVNKAKIEGIEWGGDIHVPHGNVAIARRIGGLTRDRGIAVAAYGSYYRLAVSEKDGLKFDDVLHSAVALGAPTIRVWAGRGASADADETYRKAVYDDALRVAEMAMKEGVRICYEYHANTLTDTDASARAMLKATTHPNIDTLWQPPTSFNTQDCLTAIDGIQHRLSNVHTYHWKNHQKLPLSEGTNLWELYMKRIRTSRKERYFLIEFVRDNSPEAFLNDAITLRGWIDKFGAKS